MKINKNPNFATYLSSKMKNHMIVPKVKETVMMTDKSERCINNGNKNRIPITIGITVFFFFSMFLEISVKK